MEEKESKGNIRTASGLNTLAGIWLIISPFIVGYGITAARANDIYVGIILGALALIRFLTASDSTTWLSWINVVLGAWLIVSPFILSYTDVSQIWNDVIVGILAIIFGGWSVSGARVLEESREEQERHMPGHA
jgi:hypothetical protein